MAKDRKQGKRGLNIIIVGCGKVGASLTEQVFSTFTLLPQQQPQPSSISSFLSFCLHSFNQTVNILKASLIQLISAVLPPLTRSPSRDHTIS